METTIFGNFVFCSECVFFEDCEDKELNDGCYSGMTEEEYLGE
jgi:hypothetical protein